MKGDGILKIDMCFVFLFKIFSRTRKLKAGTEHKREKQEQNICLKKKKKGKLVYLCKIKVSTN